MKGNLVIIDGLQYDEYQIDTGNQIATIREYIPTEEDLQKLQNESRITELKEIITNKNYLGDDVTAERAELRALLGL